MKQLDTLLNNAKIPYELYDHRAIFTNEDAVIVKEELGFWGTETKSLYLKDKKKKNNYIFLTYTTKQTDFKALSTLVGKRVSVVQAADMEEQTGQKAGAVSPFGYEFPVTLIIDEELLSEQKLVFAPGKPDQTMVIAATDVEKIANLLGMPFHVLPAASQEV
ncbi:MAG: YbaK/EbsC family protein [Enterococcus sp.]